MCWEKPRGPGIALALGSAGCDAPAYTVACLLCGSGIHRDVSPVWIWQVIWLFGTSTLFFLPVSKPLNSEQGNHELLLCRHWWRRRLGCYVRTPCCARCLPRCLCYPLALLFFRQSSMGLCGGRRAVRLSFAVRHRSYWIVWGRHVFVGPRRFHHHVVPSARPSSPSGVQMVNVSPSRVDPELSAP